MNDIKPYFREDLLRHCRSIVFAARIPSDPSRWTSYCRGFMDFMTAFLQAIGCSVREL